MNAGVQTRYGSPYVLQLEDVDKLAVKVDEVLVRSRSRASLPHHTGPWPYRASHIALYSRTVCRRSC